MRVITLEEQKQLFIKTQEQRRANASNPSGCGGCRRASRAMREAKKRLENESKTQNQTKQ